MYRIIHLRWLGGRLVLYIPSYSRIYLRVVRYTNIKQHALPTYVRPLQVSDLRDEALDRKVV